MLRKVFGTRITIATCTTMNSTRPAHAEEMQQAGALVVAHDGGEPVELDRLPQRESREHQADRQRDRSQVGRLLAAL
jgi:hypothetical protein